MYPIHYMLSIGQWFNPEFLLQYGGISLLLFIVFAETGVFFCFFFPGDSLLFTAGLLCGTSYLPYSYFTLLGAVFAAATFGSIFGYFSGKFLGNWLQRQPDTWLYRKEYIDIAREYHNKYGGMAFVIGRFLPIVRTFVPILSGIIRLPFSKFMFWNVIGCLFWVPVMISAGHFLVEIFPEIQHHLEKVVIFLVAITSIPIILTIRKERKKKKADNQS